MADEITKEIRNFLAEYVTSVAQLETLLWLFAHRGQAWNAEDLSREMRSTSVYAEMQLVHFEKKGLIGPTEDNISCFTYKGSPELTTKIEQLVRLYQTHRFKIIDIIHAPTLGKIHNLADAFKFRKD